MFERWSNEMNSLISNRSSADALANGYKSTAIVKQLGQDGSTLRQYELQGLWPVMVSPIQLSWEAGNAIETYGVEFSIDYWEPVGVGNADDYSGTIAPDGVASSYLKNTR